MPDLDPEVVVEALEAASHGLTCEAWAAYLLALQPGVYVEPPPPPGPVLVRVSVEQRLEIMRRRVRAGFRPIHPLDSWVGDGALCRGGGVLRNGRNGATYEAETVDGG